MQFDPKKPEFEFSWEPNTMAEDVMDKGWELVEPYSFPSGSAPPAEILAKAAQYFRAALELQPELMDAYAGLGYVESSRGNWKAAREYYARGVAIAQKVLPPTWTGKLSWGIIRNRPFFRCLHGLGLAYLNLGEEAAATVVFRWGYALNPNDNIGFRYLLGDPD